METKRIQAFSVAEAVNNSQSVTLQNAEKRKVNYHNIWFSLAIEPQDADANANGQWVLYREDDSTKAEIVPTIAVINLENENYKIIACGVWAGSNQSPYNFVSQIKTSRNIMSNGRLILVNRLEGVSAGAVRVLLMLCANQVVD